MQNCLGELNLIYCLIYLDAIVILSHTAEEHLHHLHVVFNWLREHKLKLKPSKCNFFREEITYLAHQVSKDGVWPSNSNLKAIEECMPPKIYTDVHTFLGLVGHYRRFIKGFVHIVQPLNEHLTGEGASRKSEWVTLSEEALKAFKVLKKHIWQLQFWLLLTIPNHFCGDWCIQSWVRDSAVPETAGQMISPYHLWWQSPHGPQEKLPLDKAWVFGTEVGGDRTFQGVPALSIFPS